MGPRHLILAAVFLCAACGEHAVAVAPKPNPALLQPCTEPVVGNPATDNDYAALMLDLGKAYADCRERHAGLVTFVKGTTK